MVKEYYENTYIINEKSNFFLIYLQNNPTKCIEDVKKCLLCFSLSTNMSTI